MKAAKKTFQLSLAARNALVYFVLFILAIGLSATLLISYSYKEVLKITENRLTHTTEMVHLKFESFFKNVETDLNQLASSPTLSRFVAVPDSVNLSFLASEYKSFLKSKPNYFQIRLISITDLGEELIKIERRSEKIIETPQNQLQNKSERDYYKELITLPVDSIYLSKIDLNREFGALSTPYIPTARMGKKMNGGALNDFIIIINIDLSQLFAELKYTLPQNDKLRITNKDGHYILHPNQELEFTFEFDKKGSYMDEFSEPLLSISDSSKITVSEIAVNRFSELKYNRKNYQLFSIVTANKNDVLASFYLWRKSVLIASTCIAFLFLAIAFLYMRKQVKELKSITKQLTLFSSEVGPKTLPIDRGDEIGELAREFEKMSKVVSESQMVTEAAKQKAEIAHQEKSEFLENMSHEIRNPLQSILGAVEILNQNEQLPNQKSFLESIKFSSRQLQSLANDILDYNSIKAQSIELKPDWHSLSDFCSELYNSSVYLAKTKSIDFKFENKIENNTTQVYFDAARLYQVLNNLITNALKFTEAKGHVKFTVSENNHHTFCFNISDTGIGLTADMQNKILDRHYTSGQNAGAGLGLPIVVNLLRIFKSELKIQSQPGVGSSFSFCLRLQQQKAQLKETNSFETLFDYPGEKQSILIIEDDPQIISWYQHVLKQFELKFLTHPSQLLQVKNQLFNHIISDYNFGRSQLDFTELKEEFQALLKLNGKIIIVSGQKIDVNYSDATVLLKPVDKHHLLKILVAHKVYQKPNFSSIEKDYDQQPHLIKNVMNLMITEWQKDQKLIDSSIVSRKLTDFESVYHRLITSIRRLKLTDFENLFDNLKTNWENENIEKLQKEIYNAFDFYILEMILYRDAI